MIQRDFFPTLPRLAATNRYLSALEEGDTAGVRREFREMAALAGGGGRRGGQERDAEQGGEREREMETAGTPFVSRTPFAGDIGSRGWDTPMTVRSGKGDGFDGGVSDGEEASDAAQPRPTYRLPDTSSISLDDFQSSYTSEDNASFLSILASENRARREKNQWMWDAERVAGEKRLKIEQGRRKGLIKAGGYVEEDGLMPKRLEGKEAVRGNAQLAEAATAATAATNKRLRIGTGGGVEEERQASGNIAGESGEISMGTVDESRDQDDEMDIDGNFDLEPDRKTPGLGRHAESSHKEQAATSSTKATPAPAADRETTRPGSTQNQDRTELVRTTLQSEDGPKFREHCSTSTSLIRLAPSLNQPDISDQQLVIPNSLPTAHPSRSRSRSRSPLIELDLDRDTHLASALFSAGLPSTALVTSTGAIVPSREIASGSGDGLGRGRVERERREAVEKEVFADQKDVRGKEVPEWRFRARNSLMFPPDADVDPMRACLVGPTSVNSQSGQHRHNQAPKEVQHANTRLPAEDDSAFDGENSHGVAGIGSARSIQSRRRSVATSSPARSRVAAAIHGTPYHPSNPNGLPAFNSYALVPEAPSPSPSELGPQAVSQLMTWGSILSTPRALGSGDDTAGDMGVRARGEGRLASSRPSFESTGPRFTITSDRSRDALGRKLANDAGRAMRERAKGYGPSPSSSSSLSTIGLGMFPSSGLSSGSRTSANRSRTARVPASVGGFTDMGPPSAMTPQRRADNLTPAGRSLLERTVRHRSITPRSSASASASVPSSPFSSDRRHSGERSDRFAVSPSHPHRHPGHSKRTNPYPSSSTSSSSRTGTTTAARSRQEAMERAGGWGISLGGASAAHGSTSGASTGSQRKRMAERTWTPSPAVKRDRE